MSRTTYVIRDGELVPKQFAAVRDYRKSRQVMSDIEPFVAPGGEYLSSRSHVRAYEQKHGVKQLGNDWPGHSDRKPHFWDAYQRGEYKP